MNGFQPNSGLAGGVTPTLSVFDARTPFPVESFTITVTVNVPRWVGVQLRLERLDGEHPTGSSVQLYTYHGVPPDTDAVKLDEAPKSIEDGFSSSDTCIGAAAEGTGLPNGTGGGPAGTGVAPVAGEQTTNPIAATANNAGMPIAECGEQPNDIEGRVPRK